MLEKTPLWTPGVATLEVVGRLCVRKAKKVLLMQRSATAKRNRLLWEMPGGQSEPNELDKPFLTALRETEEEIGLKPDVIDTSYYDLYTKTMVGGDKDGHVQETYTYPAWVTSDDLLALCPSEVQGADWFALEAALQLELTPAARQSLGHIAITELASIS